MSIEVLESKKSKLEELYWDLKTIDFILSRILKDWGGQGALVPIEATVENIKWLFDDIDSFSDYCKYIRELPDGEKICWKCDLFHAKKAAKAKKPIHYICKSGLIDVAVPIMVDGESIGTFLFGQRRIADKKYSISAKKIISKIEKNYDIDNRYLENLWKQTPEISLDQLELAKQDVSKICDFIGKTVSERWKFRLLSDRTKFLETELNKLSLSNLSRKQPIKNFWQVFNHIFPEICKSLNIKAGMIIYQKTSEKKPYDIRVMTPGNFVSNKSIRISSNSLFSDNNRIIDEYKNISNYLSVLRMPSLDIDPNTKISLLRVPIETDINMIVILFGFNPSEISLMGGSLSLADQNDLLTTLTSQIAYSYNAALLLRERIEHEEYRRQYVQDVSHQLIGPLSGIRAHCENIIRGRISADKFKTTLENVLESAGHVQRYANNFRLAAKINGENIFSPNDAKFDIYDHDDLIDILIVSVKSFQGMAKQKLITGPSIDEYSFMNFPNLALVTDLFEILVLNICDNAIKYAYEETPIIIRGNNLGDRVEIEFISYGIPIHSQDVERIFIRGERTDDAMKKSPEGTGIGLYICEEICKLHGGSIRTSSSKKSVHGNEAKFVTTFFPTPMKKKELAGEI